MDNNFQITNYSKLNDQCWVNSQAHSIHKETLKHRIDRENGCKWGECTQECVMSILDPPIFNETSLCFFTIDSICNVSKLPEYESYFSYENPYYTQKKQDPPQNIEEYCLCNAYNETSFFDDPLRCACYPKSWISCLNTHDGNDKCKFLRKECHHLSMNLTRQFPAYCRIRPGLCMHYEDAIFSEPILTDPPKLITTEVTTIIQKLTANIPESTTNGSKSIANIPKSTSTITKVTTIPKLTLTKAPTMKTYSRYTKDTSKILDRFHQLKIAQTSSSSNIVQPNIIHQFVLIFLFCLFMHWEYFRKVSFKTR